MINKQLLQPESIVVIGGSNNVHKPGGAVVRNLLSGGYQGTLRIVNPKEDEVQGVKVFHDAKELPPTDLAILVVAAKFCPQYVEYLAKEKEVRAFIIISAGFGEETHEGAVLEQQILDTCERYDCALIGPNCIGMLNRYHHSVFTKPIPSLNPKGVDFISGSGATAVFILESAVTKGLPFNSVWSIGNGKQIGELRSRARLAREVALHRKHRRPRQTALPRHIAHSEGLSHRRHQGWLIGCRKPSCQQPYGCHRLERLGRRGSVP